MSCLACGYRSDPADIAWVVVLHENLSSGNTIGRNVKGSDGRKYRNARRKYLKALASASTRPPAATYKRHVSIVRWYAKRKRPYDRDNLIAGSKPLIDCLKTLSYILDDCPLLFVPAYFQGKSDTGNDRIEVIVKEYFDDEKSVQ